jgi:hypothetical protein
LSWVEMKPGWRFMKAASSCQHSALLSPRSGLIGPVDGVCETSPTDYATQMLGTATFWNRCGEAMTEDG